MSLLARDLVVVTGKGGVGKTTVAAAIALAAQRRGLRALVAEVAGRRDAVPLLAGSGVAHESVTPRAAMEEYLHDQLPAPLAALLGRSGTFAAFVEATPGMNELLSVGKVWELAGGRRRSQEGGACDLVVLDAPASGHGLALLGAPRTFAEAARVGPINRQAGAIAAMLCDPARTAVVAVALPEEMPVNETLELRDALRERMGLELGAVVVNGVAPDRFSAADARRLEAAGGRPGSPLAAALWAHAHATDQQGQLRRLREGLGAEPLELPFVFEAELGEHALRRLAEHLEPVL